MAAWTKRLLVFVVLMAMVAGLTPSASAQQTPGADSKPVAVPPPQTFVPGAINRTPLGGPIPDDEVRTIEDAPELDHVNPGGELVERHTETSRTFATDSGSFKTVL